MSEKTYPEVRKKRGWLWFWGILIILCIIALAVIIPVYFLLIKPHQNSSSGSTASDSGTGGTSGNNGSTGGNGNGGGNGATPAPAFTGAITGGDGSTVTRDDGSTFVYTNAFGGTWYFDPSNPFVGGAQANEWTPRLNETWRWGVDQIRGVNLGGWLVTEPFIVPALYEPYQTGDFAPPYNAVDEWTLTVAMNKTGNATAMLDAHYSTFITEDDFAAIAAAGLNWVRIPIPYWAIEVYPGEPFVPHLAWQYFLKAIQWARKYGLRINMDLHTIPGSQNGWNHSGKLGPVNFLFGVMGIANAQRALAYIRTLAEFVSQPEYSQVVQYFGVVNEALVDTIGQPQMQTFYLEAYTMIRNITGLGQGNGPFIGIHDGFIGMQQWASFLQGSDRIAMDTHPYNAFNDASNAPLSSYIPSPCTGWGPALNQSMDQFGFSHAGEWSAAVNDCGKWVNGVGLGTRYEGTYPGTTTVIGSCDQWTEYGSWSPTTIQQTKEVVMASMDALQHWFFWTWKIGNSSVTGNIESPSWSYSLGLQHGWIPLDPRDAVDFCALSADVSMPSPTAGLQSWQTGGVGAGTIAADQLASFSHWPIISMNSAAGLSYLPPASVALLPQYVPTGGVITLPGPTFTTPSSTQTADAGNGWANADDTAGYYVPIVGCAYPNPWDAESATIPPTAQCQPTGVTRRGLEMDVGERAVPTPPPMIRSA
ncbi:glycoside hydrolase [Dacryopinax primogenitus]|uniref:glucan 1,3-beta-glucosidase n=1 Tax=Dacryopinax primogenitus (strain DJM 731) TaxID=1858805 RepID=M5G3R6_DACPD|nr:glycoside hydrolase [Dacryopinax primogenitus]EJT98402.1 glycoside hydrolase [Dacryopinax primogenitus]